jgi:hypothetical protein
MRISRMEGSEMEAEGWDTILGPPYFLWQKEVILVLTSEINSIAWGAAAER